MKYQKQYFFEMLNIEKLENEKITRWAWARDIEQIPEPFWTSVYFVDGILIDSGPPAGVEDFKEFIESIGSREAIEKVILTHWHEDHSGGAKYLTEELELPVYIHEEGLEVVKKGFSYPDYRELAWGGPLKPAPKVHPLDFDSVSSKSGEYEFELVHVPGHSSDLICLMELEEEWVFISDSVVSNYQMIFGEGRKDLPENMEPVHDNMEQIYFSLKKLQEHVEKMENASIFTASQGKFEDSKIIEKNIQQIEELHEGIQKYKDQGLEDEEIVEKIFGEEHIVGELTQKGLSRINVIKSLKNSSL